VTGELPAAPFRRRDALLALAVAAGLAVPMVLALGRAPLPREAAIAGLAVLVPVLSALAWMDGRGRAPSATRAALLLVTAASLTPLGWFFGPNAGFAAAIALIALLSGLLSRPGPYGWSTAAMVALIAAGQATLLLLVLARALPDASLAPVIIAGHPDWQHAAAHAAVQGVFVGAFLAGRSLRDRYAGVRAAISETRRGVALKDALLEEARADYRRALRAIRSSGPESSTPRVIAPADLPSAATPAEHTSLASEVRSPPRTPSETTATTRLWMDAYRLRMQTQRVAVVALCLTGNGILLVIGRNRVPLLVGLASMTLVAALALLQGVIAQRRREEAAQWPWTAVGVLSAGAAYAFGLHSAFACVIAALLFFGGSFRTAPGNQRAGGRLPVYLGVVLTHGAVFALIMAGLVPDDGNQPVLAPEHAPLEPFVLHVLLQLVYAAAFVGGWMTDARFQEALREAASAEAALRGSTEVLMRTDAEIARVLEESGSGLFSGERIGGYTLGRRIASGSLGDVYEASRIADGRPIALKLVRWDRASDRIALDLLAREAGALARVSSPSVARILEAGVDHDLPYVAMERIDGEPLADVLRARGRLPLKELRELARDLLRGVRDVHDAGIVHRDIKPHNVMRSRATEPGAPVWKIVDFGLAMHGLPGGASAQGGTPAYIAPEQALGERVDPRADLYSACLVIYRALTGRPAFVGNDAQEIALRARRAGPPDPRQHADISRELELVLRLGLAAEPKDRFATARELAAALEAALDGTISDAHRTRAEALLARSPWQDTV